MILTSDVIDHTMTLCEGDLLTMVATGEGFPVGSTLDWYLVEGSENPYNGEGELIGSAPVSGDPCGNIPEILYIMVNPDNTQVGGSGDQCDEFLVLWTGSGGYNTSDILVSNLGPGSFQWDDYAAGNGANFSCGVPLPPGEVPEDAILIIQSSPDNNVFINIDALCATGLPVYIITYTGTIACTGGYFDNNSPCSSCPVMVDIGGAGCTFDFELDYNPPGSSIDGWAWANTGPGVYADVVPVLDIPVFVSDENIIDDLVWVIPDDFCEVYTGSNYAIAAIPNPPPVFPCLEVITPYYGFEVGCGSISLSGGGDVCMGNCPEAPTEMVFTLSGNDGPYIVDIEISATLFGTFPINGLEVSNGEVIYVCLEGFFPSFDPGTGILNVPVLAVGFMASVEIVGATTASGCPIDLDQNIITLHFIAAPTANLGSDQTICAGETVDLSGNIGGSAVSFMWSTNGDGVFNPQDDLETVYTPGDDDIANGEVALTLFSFDPNSSCIPGEASLTVFIDPSLQIEVNTPLTICDNDVATVIAMITGSNAPCIWETDGDGTFDDPNAESTIYNPGFFDILTGTVTLHYIPVDPDACVQSNEPLILTLVAAPEVDIPQDLEVCEGDSIVIEIDVSGDYASIIWSYPGDGFLIIEDDFNVTYTPGPMDIDNQFFTVSVTVISVYPECGSITYNIPVFVAFCDCPDFETIPPTSALCYSSDTLDLESLFVIGGSGAWSITAVPAGSNPAILIGGDTLITNMSDPGVYTVTYTLNFPEPGCPATSNENITVIGTAVPNAGMDMAFCGYQSVQLMGDVVPATANPTLWEALGDGTIVNPALLATTYLLGTTDSMATQLTFVLHAMDAVCGNTSDSVTMFFNQPPVTTFVNDSISVCNMPENGSVINFDMLITGGDGMGTWSNPFNVPVDFSRPDSVDFDGVAEGFYIFQYETNSAMSPCSETVYTIVVEVEECNCPFIMIQNVPSGICNTQQSLPLDAFIQAGGPGGWLIIATPPGSNPATISGSTMIIDGSDPGVYDLRFTFDAAPIDGCPDSAEISITIQEPPLVNVSVDTVICGEGDMQIDAMISGSSTGVIWSTSGTGLFNDNTILNPVYSASSGDVILGQVLLMVTTIDTFGYCADQLDTIVLSIQTPPFATLSALTDTLCNHPDSMTVVNLSALIIAGDGSGIWSDVDGAMVDLSDPTQVDFQAVSAGSYRMRYVTQSAVSPCVDSMYVFTIVVEDCSCPFLDLSPDVLINCQGDTINLDDQIVNAAPGAWTMSSGPSGIWPVIMGAQLTTNNAAGGTYLMTYTLTDSIPDCPASSSITLELESQPSFTVIGVSCDADQIIYEVIVETDALNLNTNYGVVTDLGNGGFSIDSIPAGQDVEIRYYGSSGQCSWFYTVTTPDCDCTLFIEDIADTIRFCPGDTFVLIPFVTGAQGLPFATWVTPYGTFMQPTLPLFQEGTYIWIVRDLAGCEERDTFNVRFIGPEGVIVSSLPPSCPDGLDGEIIIESVIDGTPPFMGQLDNGAPFVIGQLPYIIDQVSLGDHVLSITDIIGCTIMMPVAVSSQTFGSISLGPDLNVLKGDSVLIEPINSNVAVASVIWNPTMPGQAFESFWLLPNASMALTATVTDTAGCVYEDQLLITVYETSSFYIPNVFSPNNDGVNDVFEIVTNLPPEQLLSLEIFDRWGNMVFAQYGTVPYQWDGFTNGKKVQSGVYVYKFTWQSTNGDTQAEVGDVTVLR